MKRLFLQYICLVLLFTGSFGLLGALELEINGGMNRLTFHPDRTRAHTEPETSKEFGEYPFALANFSIRHDITNTMAFSFNYERDNILQNNVNFRFVTRSDHFKIDFGPFVGIFDDLSMPDAGIMGTFELTLPGIAFLSLSVVSSLGTQFDFTSENFRESLEGKLGFWLPGMILSVSANTRNLSRYSVEDENILTRDDFLTRYTTGINFYSKNSPISLDLNAGHQTMRRIYKRGTGIWEYTDQLESFFGNFELQLQVSKPVRVKLGFEMPFFIKSKEPMTVVPEFWNLYKASAGFVYTFFPKDYVTEHE